MGAICRTTGTSSIVSLEIRPSNTSDDNGGDNEIAANQGICAVCLGPRIETWIFMPCRHATRGIVEGERRGTLPPTNSLPAKIFCKKVLFKVYIQIGENS